MSSSPQPVADLLADLARGLRALDVRWFLFGADLVVELERVVAGTKADTP